MNFLADLFPLQTCIALQAADDRPIDVIEYHNSIPFMMKVKRSIAFTNVCIENGNFNMMRTEVR
ncbi:hypothetical protein D3C85_1725820 [compost metagenome]